MPQCRVWTPDFNAWNEWDIEGPPPSLNRLCLLADLHVYLSTSIVMCLYQQCKPVAGSTYTACTIHAHARLQIIS